MANPADLKRSESDSLGTRELPRDALYGINTLRGAENFCISGRRIGDATELVVALAQIKWAAALTNSEIGLLAPEFADAIGEACREIVGGRHHDQFIVDPLEGSGGTSIHMNANEVIANRALQLMGRNAGDYGSLHPNDHVNLGQSTNDVLPSAIKLAVYCASGPLVDSLKALATVLQGKADEFADILRIGRTCLQAAQPMMLGQAFQGYASAVERASCRVAEARRRLLSLPLGGTAIGTGLGCGAGYRERVLVHLGKLSGVEVSPPASMFDGMQNSDDFARFSGEVRVAAEVIAKISSDFVILGSAPNPGLAEIWLPPMQAGSSIMPGKINPVLPIMMQQIAFAAMGNDASVSLACLNGQLEINHFEPIIASCILESVGLLANGSRIFAAKCVAGIEANKEQSLRNLLDSCALATAFVPVLGYEKTSESVKTAEREGKSFLEFALELDLLSKDQIIDLLRASTDYPSDFPD